MGRYVEGTETLGDSKSTCAGISLKQQTKARPFREEAAHSAVRAFVARVDERAKAGWQSVRGAAGECKRVVDLE